MTSPEQLFERSRQRADGPALAAVFDRLAPELLLIAGHVATVDAEDLVQATFLDAIEKHDRWDASRPLRGAFTVKAGEGGRVEIDLPASR